ncbi:hypothetical protein XA68_17149 [Ophiocordyceps unilateralis]|uniref:Uncharacterized protein n=1 Tax=Ophiocordyceps unilateralis TaxID=268505 RepID=A0A2A9P4E2_OPHUN|nr:hypothetical protein XA68_17149 [Ophiocordyceps unilateralis]
MLLATIRLTFKVPIHDCHLPYAYYAYAYAYAMPRHAMPCHLRGNDASLRRVGAPQPPTSDSLHRSRGTLTPAYRRSHDAPPDPRPNWSRPEHLGRPARPGLDTNRDHVVSVTLLPHSQLDAPCMPRPLQQSRHPPS